MAILPKGQEDRSASGVAAARVAPGAVLAGFVTALMVDRVLLLGMVKFIEYNEVEYNYLVNMGQHG